MTVVELVANPPDPPKFATNWTPFVIFLFLLCDLSAQLVVLVAQLVRFALGTGSLFTTETFSSAGISLESLV